MESISVRLLLESEPPLFTFAHGVHEARGEWNHLDIDWVLFASFLGYLKIVYAFLFVGVGDSDATFQSLNVRQVQGYAYTIKKSVNTHSQNGHKYKANNRKSRKSYEWCKFN